MPAWYVFVRAARALGVAPWELAQQPAIWAEWGMAAENVEAEARVIARKRGD